MKVLKYYNGEKIECEYPRAHIDEPIIGIEEGIIFCVIEEADAPTFNPDKSFLKVVYEMDFTPRADYPHLCTCVKRYDVIDYTQNTIIDKLNESYEEAQNTVPQAERINNIADMMYYLYLQDYGVLSAEQSIKMQYINSLDNWRIRLRLEREKRELEYLTDNIFPSFEWELKPQYNG